MATIAYSGVHIAAGSSNTTSVTSGSVDTSNCTLLFACVASAATTLGTFFDSKSNTWTALTQQQGGGVTGVIVRSFYAANPTVGTGHTFSVASIAGTFPSLAVVGFTGVAALSPLDAQNGVSNGTFPQVDTSQAVGSITPSAATNVMTACMAWNNAVTVVSIGSSYNITDTLTNDGNHFAISMAYKLSPSGAQNPSFAWTTADSPGGTHASFKAAPVVIAALMNGYRQRGRA